MTHGVLLLDKPSGISSNVALQRVRRLYAWPKAGHTGTLDPLATGLLPICLGEATKFSHSLLDADKTYEASIRLGFVSSTGDAEGVVEPCGKPNFTASQLQEVLGSFIGPIDQIPPMHSALKKNGRPLYSYARAGETVARPPRKIIINALHCIDNKEDLLTVSVSCSKGTYIRVLAEDIGKALGCGGYLLALRRTGIRDLGLREAIGLDQLGEMDETSRAAQLLPVDRLVKNLPVVHLGKEASQRIINGLAISDASTDAGLVRLYDSTGAFLGVGERLIEGTLIPKRLVSQAAAIEKPASSARLSP
ncbi:MAG: tRNA pseudouridine(55) synthase TruB [Betaproteobacteria bacterium]|nr:tRNA pseudouridine(55) synthase TruB [Betaproteobacteria bacterium]